MSKIWLKILVAINTIIFIVVRLKARLRPLTRE